MKKNSGMHIKIYENSDLGQILNAINLINNVLFYKYINDIIVINLVYVQL